MSDNNICFRAHRNIVAAVVCTLLMLIPHSSASADTSPRLSITQTPPFGQCGLVQGTTSGVAPADYYVALLIYIPGAGWWSKPYCDPRYVTIANDGTWSANMCSGGIDNTATMVEAYLFPKASYPSSYPTCVMGAGCVPSSLISASVASDRVLRSGQRKIRWSGYDWTVKSSGAGVGPGSNYFSDSIDNVWVDSNGRLHLRITNRSGRWYCPELSTESRLGYGTYRFYCDSRLDNLDPAVTLGLFTWSDFSCDPAHREIDIEFSKWGNQGNPNNAQYVIQPWDTPGNLHPFLMTSSPTSTHTFIWTPDTVSFTSVEGHFSDPTQGIPVAAWTFSRSQDCPPSLDERLHLNLWLNNSSAPLNGQEAEVILSRFNFAPFREPGTPTYGITNKTATDTLTAMVREHTRFRLWGRVMSKDCSSITIDDGSSSGVKVPELGHTYGLDDYLAAEGLLSGGYPRVLEAASGRVWRLK